MATAGIGYFDHSGQFHKTPQDATLHDLAEILGRVGEREGLAAGIAQILLDRRVDIEKIFFEHDMMVAEVNAGRAGEETERHKHSPDENISVFPAHG